MSRACSWSDPDAVGKRTRALEPHAESIATKGLSIYDSVDFKQGINLELLTNQEDMLADLMFLDPRGGYFKQPDLMQAVSDNILTSKLKDKVCTPTALAEYESEEDVVQMVTYKIRVMLAHCRRRFDNESSGLEKINKIMYSHNPGGPPPPLRPKRQRRMPSVSNPFLHFNEPDPEVEPEEEEEEPTRIAAWFDGKAQAAKMMMSNGEIKFADKYIAGEENGFIVARWLQPKYELELEVPNSCLIDGRVKLYAAPEPKAVAPKAKAKGKTSKRPAAADGVDGADDSEQSPVEFKIANGHANAVVIFVQSSNKDKSQICTVSSSSVTNSSLTPRQLCEKIKADIDHLACACDWPIKEFPEQLDFLRTKAKEAKDSLLVQHPVADLG